MDKKVIIIIAFVLVSLIQLYIPLSMVLSKEDISESGKSYKFKAEPIDPTDPFRGKYITLRFNERSVSTPDSLDWSKGETIYLQLAEGEDGFARLVTGTKEKPNNSSDFLKAKVRYAIKRNNHGGMTRVSIKLPFERYYMEESKAYDAELAYRKVRRDTAQTAYALVKIKEGESLLNDFLINDVSIEEYLELNQTEEKSN